MLDTVLVLLSPTPPGFTLMLWADEIQEDVGNFSGKMCLFIYATISLQSMLLIFTSARLTHIYETVLSDHLHSIRAGRRGNYTAPLITLCHLVRPRKSVVLSHWLPQRSYWHQPCCPFSKPWKQVVLLRKGVRISAPESLRKLYWWLFVVNIGC